MPKAEWIKMILQALGTSKVELDSTQKAALESELEELPLAHSENVLKDGQVAVDETFYNSQRTGLKDFKKKFRDEKQAHNDLKEAIDSGDSTQTKLVINLKDQIKVLKPRAERLMAQARKKWESLADDVPEKAASLFAAVDKDADEGTELTDDQVIDNLDKYEELTGAGLFPTGGDGGEGTEGTEGKPAGKPAADAAKIAAGQSGKKDSLFNKPVVERMAGGYDKMDVTTVDVTKGQQT